VIRFAGCLAFLFVLEASAQIVSPIEQSYGPYARPSNGFEPALAASNDAILLAWSEVMPTGLTQIRMGLLDFHGRLVSPISTIATTISAVSPAVLYDGTAFRVEYVESDMRFSVDVDSRGAPIGLPQLAPPRTGGILTASLAPNICWSPFCVPQGTFTLSWSGPGVRGSYILDRDGAFGPVAGGRRGDHIVLAWYSPSGVWFAGIAGTLRNIGKLPVPVWVTDVPAVGCDDTHCLIAFTTRERKIYGLLIDAAQPWLPTPVPIETESSVERPQVHVLQNGRFLVVYTSSAFATENRFAGRIVTTKPEPVRRRRAVH
jgi:hypothetical protein